MKRCALAISRSTVGASQGVCRCSGRMRELIYGLQHSSNLRARIPKHILSQLLAFDESTIPNEQALLAYIDKHHPKLLLSESYARKKGGQERQMREVMRRGEFAPTIEITEMSRRGPSEADASLAQKRFLRDLGVRDEALLARLGTYQASELINKTLEARDAENSGGSFLA